MVVPARSCRACVCVPLTGHAAEVGRAARIDADQVVLDLRSVPVRCKTDVIRLAVADAVNSLPWAAPTVAVQLNDSGTRWFQEDIVQLVMLVGSGVDRVIVPDVREPAQVLAAAQLLDEIEHEFPVERPIRIEARIGSARGVVNADVIAAASPRLDAVIFDCDDYARSLGISPFDQIDDVVDQWSYARSRIANAGYAADLAVIDGPSHVLSGVPDRSRAAALRARAAGYTGKWTMNPAEVELFRTLFK